MYMQVLSLTDRSKGSYTVFCQMLPYIGIKSPDLHSLLSENHEVIEWFGLEGILKLT